jgi:disulfide bond formation protein DsbB
VTAFRHVLDPLTEGRRPALVILVASVATLGSAFLFQHVGGLAPCVLCVYQRYPYGVAIALGLVALFTGDARLRGILLALAALALLIDAGVAAFHVGVEQHWWEGTAACTGSASEPANSLEALRQQVLSSGVVRCDSVPWALFGISLAGYNLLIALGLALFGFAAARQAGASKGR